jgi:hypothetical protein
LLFGALIVAIIGLWGLTPKTVFGVTIAWPYAALWGAIGWGRVGLSLRPMLVLIVFGLILDINSNAPLGCFVVMNLVTYGLSAAVAGMLDVDSDPIMAVVVPAALLLAGHVVLWIIASFFTDFPQRVTPLLFHLVTTGIGYALFANAFHLGRPPGMFGRQNT